MGVLLFVTLPTPNYSKILQIKGYVGNTNWWIDPFGLNIVEHFSDFDAALRRAFEIATGGDDSIIFIPKKVDPLTGTEVEFLGSNNSKIAFDSPHPYRSSIKGEGNIPCH